MRKFVILSLLVVPIFIFSWTLVYLTFMGFNFDYYFRFLRFALSTQVGEIVVFMRIYSILLTFFLMAIIYFRIRKKRF